MFNWSSCPHSPNVSLGSWKLGLLKSNIYGLLMSDSFAGLMLFLPSVQQHHSNVQIFLLLVFKKRRLFRHVLSMYAQYRCKYSLHYATNVTWRQNKSEQQQSLLYSNYYGISKGWLHCTLSCSAVYCKRPCLFVYLFVCGSVTTITRNCDNSKLRASIFTALGL